MDGEICCNNTALCVASLGDARYKLLPGSYR